MDTVNGPKKLRTLFDECVLRVPPYQRAYAWSPNPHLESFLADLRNHPTDEEKSYFYGTILLSRAKDIRRHHLLGYDVVDGQQRLSTACIFIAAALPFLDKDPTLSRFAEHYRETFIRDRLGSRKFETITSDDGFFEQLSCRVKSVAPAIFKHRPRGGSLRPNNTLKKLLRTCRLVR